MTVAPRRRRDTPMPDRGPRWRQWWARLLQQLEHHPPPPGGPFFC